MKPDEIIIPDQFTQAILKSKFHVIEMTANYFFSSEPLQQLVDIREGHKIEWHDFQRIIYERVDGFSFDVLNYGCENVQRVALSLQCSPDIYSKTKLKRLYPNGCPISKSKFDDLQKLIQNIPEKYRNFYQKLSYENNVSNEDFGLSSRVSNGESSEDEDFN